MNISFDVEDLKIENLLLPTIKPELFDPEKLVIKYDKNLT